MFSNFIIKQKVFRLIAIVLILISLIGLYTYRAITPVTDSWAGYQSQAAQRQQLLLSIKADFGYGGMIHNFKNYVLRGQDKYVSRIDNNFKTLTQTIARYNNLDGITEEEQAALKAIAEVAGNYHRNTSLVQKLFSQGKSATDVDGMVKISDKPALDAFDKLDEHYHLMTGDFSGRIDGAISDASYSLIIGLTITALLITAALGWLYASVIPPLNNLNKTMADIAEGEGDISVRLNESRLDELGQLAKAFNLFISKLESIIIQQQSIIQNIADRANGLSQAATSSHQAIENQQSHTEQLATAINELSATVNDVATNASTASTASESADSLSTEGLTAVNQSMKEVQKLQSRMQQVSGVIGEVSSASDEIGQVVSVISGIAEQTNLLALNAAIEAARAGESGRGFAVVADEVRGLAQRTTASLEDIRRMTDQLQSGTRGAVSAIEQGQKEVENSVSIAQVARDNIEQVNNEVSTIRDMNIQIATAAEEQSAVTEDMNQNVHSVSLMSSSILEDSTRIAQESDGLARLSMKLKELVGQFKVSARS